MIRAEMIPDEVVEAAARALSEAELWPGVWSRLDSVVQDAFTAQARAAIAAALNAWPGALISPDEVIDGELLPPIISLPFLQKERSDD